MEDRFDDRDERPGVKFKDADLVRFPVPRGAESLAEFEREVSLRRDRRKPLVPVVEAVPRVMELLEKYLGAFKRQTAHQNRFEKSNSESKALESNLLESKSFWTLSN